MGIRHLACLMNLGGPDAEVVEHSMRLFAEMVMPRSGRRKLSSPNSRGGGEHVDR